MTHKIEKEKKEEETLKPLIMKGIEVQLPEDKLDALLEMV